MRISATNVDVNLHLNEDMIMITTIKLNHQRQKQGGIIPNSIQMKQFNISTCFQSFVLQRFLK